MPGAAATLRVAVGAADRFWPVGRSSRAPGTSVKTVCFQVPRTSFSCEGQEQRSTAGDPAGVRGQMVEHAVRVEAQATCLSIRSPRRDVSFAGVALAGGNPIARSGVRVFQRAGCGLARPLSKGPARGRTKG